MADHDEHTAIGPHYTVIPDENLVLNNKQTQALSDRFDQLNEKAREHTAKQNQTMVSNYSGRRFLAIMRMNRDGRPVEVLDALHRTEQERVLGVKEAAKRFIWSAVSKGFVEEQEQITKLLAANADTDAEPTR
jgi:hypothetical protein